MKKKICISSFILLMAACSCYITIANNKSAQITSVMLENVEVLAQNEGSDWWTQPETRRCKLELGGGWFESSVERICTFCATPNSCTPVECGTPF